MPQCVGQERGSHKPPTLLRLNKCVMQSPGEFCYALLGNCINSVSGGCAASVTSVEKGQSRIKCP
jgi:hypothetical protein